MLKSKFIDEFSIDKPLSEYPRPQLIRESYVNLNGIWDFAISSKDELPNLYVDTIIVPYCVESSLSRINKRVEKGQFLYYKKKFSLSRKFFNDKTLLHFGAVDQICKVYINKTLVGSHENGYLPFSFDITKYVKVGDNEIIVCVQDDLDMNYPYGKQKDNNKGMWYTPVSGIWQTIWLESVPKDYIKNITITPEIDNNLVRIVLDSEAEEYRLLVYDGKKVIYDKKQTISVFEITLDKMKLWSPEEPFLYDVIIKTKHDFIKSYFAMRKFSFSNKKFLLNNKPYFVHGLLDQGYFVEGIYTPSTYKLYENDILTAKALGFNCLRKHIKIEPLIFYHYCDKYGMLVFQDMVNNGKYSFFVDTAMPTIGLSPLAKKFKSTPEKQKNIFREGLLQTINHLYNCPCIVYYTIFNEGWGQHEADSYYQLLKSVDNARVVDSTSGWFKEKESDVNSLHVYFRKIKLKPSDKTTIVSEFGGYTYKVAEHFYKDTTYGYKHFDNLKDYNDAIYKLYKEDIINNIKNGLAGCIYTQLTDVEEEINGLLTFDRQICKLDKEVAKQIIDEINKEFYHD